MDSTLKEHFCKTARFAGTLAVGFPCDSAGKKPACKEDRRPGFDPWVGKIPWRSELATLLQYSGLQISWTVQSMGSQRVRHHGATFTSFLLLWVKTNFCYNILMHCTIYYLKHSNFTQLE